MSAAKFKTMRHIETLRNYLNAVVRELLNRQEQHDQSKLQPPEVEILEEFTPRLRGMTYGSQEYRDCLAAMKPMIDHHNAHNRHHPEHHTAFKCINCHRPVREDDESCGFCGADKIMLEQYVVGIRAMNLIDLLEMLCDWKAAGLRHDDGDLMRSIKINQKRFGYSDELAGIFRNTAEWINAQEVYHRADES